MNLLFQSLRGIYVDDKLDASQYSLFWNNGGTLTAVTFDTLRSEILGDLPNQVAEAGAGIPIARYTGSYIEPEVVPGDSTSIVIGSGASSMQSGSVIAIGYMAKASGSLNFAVGYEAEANYYYSTAIGNYAKSSQAQSVAVGYRSLTTKTNQFSIAELDPDTHLSAGPRLLSGVADPEVAQDAVNLQYLNTRLENLDIPEAIDNTNKIPVAQVNVDDPSYTAPTMSSPGYLSLAIGSGSESSTNSIAVGINATAASDAIAVGYSATASSEGTSFGNGANSQAGGIAVGNADAAYRAVAIGTDASTNDDYQIAIGYNSSSNHSGSYAFGNGASTTRSNQLALAPLTVSTHLATTPITVSGVADPITAQDAVNLQTLDTRLAAMGDASLLPIAPTSAPLASGNKPRITGDSDVAIGSASRVEGTYGIAIGRTAIAYADSIALGRNAATSVSYSICIGYAASAIPSGGVAIGRSANASNGVAIGPYSLATAASSAYTATAIGNGAAATYNSSTAIGASSVTTKSNQFSIAALDSVTHLASTPRILSGVANPVVGQDAVNLQTLDTRLSGIKEDLGFPIAPIPDADGTFLSPVASGNQSIAIGYYARALDSSSSGSISIGQNSLTNYASTIAIGYNASAGGDSGALAIGYNASSQQYSSTALGYGSNTTKENQVSIAGLNASTHLSSTPRLISGVANPEVDQDAVNLGTLNSRLDALSFSITTYTDEAEFDAAVAGPNELLVLTDE